MTKRLSEIDFLMLLFQYGGELAKILDLDTNEFIVSALNSLWWQNNGVWIGLNDRGREQHWHWSSGQRTRFLSLNLLKSSSLQLRKNVSI